jgi:dipeptidyl-peptidase 4
MRPSRPAVLCAASATVALLSLALPARPQTAAAAETPAKKNLDVEVLFSPDSSVRRSFSGKPLSALGWLDAGRYLAPAEEGKGWRVVEARTGRSTPFFDPAKLEAAFARLPGFGAEDAAGLGAGCFVLDEDDPLAARACPRPLALSADRKAVVVNQANDLFYYRFGADAATRLTAGPEAEEQEAFSPDGRLVSFIRGNDLYVVDTATGRERALTTGGGPKLLHGKLDWVYQEEIYGRGDFRAYWWSPDSRRIAFLQLDEEGVPEATVIDHVAVRQELEVTPYPQPGDPNPKVAVGVVAAAGGEAVWVDLSRSRPSDPVVVGVGWTPDAAKVVIQVQDREQTWLDLDLADPATGAVTTLFRDRSAAFIEAGEKPTYLADGSFLWPTMRSGWKHLYHYAADGKLLAEVTPGEWEIDRLAAVDEKRGVVYVTSNRDAAPGRQIYRIGLDGTGLTPISRRAGTHLPIFSPDGALYLDRWSDVTTPTQVRLHDADGGELRVLEANPVAALDEFRWGPVEFFQVPARDGLALEASIIKPPDFDPSRRHPVLIYHYGGPHAPMVQNRFDAYQYPWHQMLAERGYVIFECDNRSASGKGWLGTFEAYRHLGVVELRDTEDCVSWLQAQSWVDPDRIGIAGWSYGGFLTAYVLTHSTSFKIGIAGAPVTDWRLYDSLYTERYMRRPENNPEGYEETSVIAAAGNLHGKLLLLHGTTDDNVHLQNTVKLIYELAKAGKDYQLALYPRTRHVPFDRKLVYQMRKLMTEFVEENL